MEAIPEELPSGLKFVDSMEVIVMNGSQEVTVLPRNSSNTISFLVDPETSLDAIYSILYWDPNTNKGEGGWVSLPVMPVTASVENYNQSLDPSDPSDQRVVIVPVYKLGNSRIQVTTNFAGIFVLAK
jgi:hypothetical protein